MEDARAQAHPEGLDVLILAATFNHAARIILERLAASTRSSSAALYRTDRTANLFRRSAACGGADSYPESIALDGTEAASLMQEGVVSDRTSLFDRGAARGWNVHFVHPLGHYLIAVARLELPDAADAEAALAPLRHSGRIYSAILAQAEEKDRMTAERERLWALQREVSELEVNLDQPELKQVLEGLLDAAIARVGAGSGCVLLSHGAKDDLVLERFAFRGPLRISPEDLPRVLQPRRGRVPRSPERRANPGAGGIYFRVFESGRPYVSGKLPDEPDYAPLFESSRSCLAVPISSPYGGSLGVLMVESDQPHVFTHEQVAPLRDLADIARTYILKARLYHATAAEAHPVLLVGIDRKTVESALMAARYEEPILLVGETGTGKELLARAIHRSGPRAPHPFEAVNCGAISGPLALSHLFGHVRGAYTDAKETRPGVLEIADGGTLLLDEIEKMPVETQYLFLRVIETQEFSPLGAPHVKKRVNVRLIAATNADLKKRMETGAFLADLYFRISCLTLQIPPLRERRHFVPKLIERMIARVAQKYGRPVPKITPRAMRMLREYDYPGNVRELQNVAARAFTLDSNGEIDVDDLPEELLGPGRLNDTRRVPAMRGASAPDADSEKTRIEDALRKSSGSAGKASRIYGVSRATFYRLLKQHHINSADYRS